MENFEKEYLSYSDIRKLVTIAINNVTIGNDCKIKIEKMNSDKYEILITLKKLNTRVMTFANCGFTNSKNISFDYDDDFNILTEYFRIFVSESIKMKFEEEISKEGFDFLIKRGE